ncbi:kinase-like protein [Dendrothele bispora CBS 962.96]|uniref:Kinase-like protein n=1 Tax=Dendrothele bispora (strain CBS 962.96) TaxID=1314807 RepID=A0A4S8LC44_DENBC|nr:kinase-like protein [Dendrothele bispora CBS 962.96]
MDAVEASFAKTFAKADITESLCKPVLEWWNGSINAHTLISRLGRTQPELRKKPHLFQDLSPVLELKGSKCVIIVTPDQQEVHFAICFEDFWESKLQGEVIPISSIAKRQPCDIRTTVDLRVALDESPVRKIVSEIDSIWAPSIMQLLQYELDDPDTEGDYWRKCFKLMHALEKGHRVLPPSLYLHDIVKEGNFALRGGGFADIWKGFLGEEIVCLKVLRTFVENDLDTRDKIISDFRREALLWRQLNHPNLLAFLGVNTELFAPGFCLVSPWMANGDVISYLKTHPQMDKLCAMTEVAAGLAYLHSLQPSIVHGDIRGANILVTDDLRCCLADFGLSISLETQMMATTTGKMKGCFRWLAPECLDPSSYTASERNNRPSRDIYAFGCTVLEIITGAPPFADKKMDGAVLLDVIRGIRPDRPDDFDMDSPDEVWRLVTRCWAQKPEQRPYSSEVHSELQRLYDARSCQEVHDTLSRSESKVALDNLKKKVLNWKGLDVDSLGELALHDVVMVSEGHWCRTFYVYVFEEVILFFRRRTLHRRAPLVLQSKVILSVVKDVGPDLPAYSISSLANEYFPAHVRCSGGGEFTLWLKTDGQRFEWVDRFRSLVSVKKSRRSWSETESFLYIDEVGEE